MRRMTREPRRDWFSALQSRCARPAGRRPLRHQSVAIDRQGPHSLGDAQKRVAVVGGVSAPKDDAPRILERKQPVAVELNFVHHSAPERGFVASSGRAGWMKPIGRMRRARDEEIRHNISGYIGQGSRNPSRVRARSYVSNPTFNIRLLA
jgi:hypothetical protein